MGGQYIDVKAADASGTFKAYLATPPQGKGPGIVIIQEIFGLNEFVIATADAYAAKGYVTIAPDLFWRQQPGVNLGYSDAEWKQAFAFMQGFDQALGVEDIDATIDVLRARPEFTNGVGAIGFCLGGKLAYLTACRTSADVSIGYYGVGIEDALDEAANIRGELLLHIAGDDQYCPPEAQRKIVDTLDKLANVELHVYPNVDHAFARPQSPHHDAAATKLAEQRTDAALAAVIGPR